MSVLDRKGSRYFYLGFVLLSVTAGATAAFACKTIIGAVTEKVSTHRKYSCYTLIHLNLEGHLLLFNWLKVQSEWRFLFHKTLKCWCTAAVSGCACFRSRDKNVLINLWSFVQITGLYFTDFLLIKEYRNHLMVKWNNILRIKIISNFLVV